MFSHIAYNNMQTTFCLPLKMITFILNTFPDFLKPLKERLHSPDVPKKSWVNDLFYHWQTCNDPLTSTVAFSTRMWLTYQPRGGRHYRDCGQRGQRVFVEINWATFRDSLSRRHSPWINISLLLVKKPQETRDTYVICRRALCRIQWWWKVFLL